MKKCLLAFLILFFFPIFLSSCGQNKDISSYSMHIVFDDETKSLCVRQSVNYINTSDNAFESIKFHLYPNAFREDAKRSPVSIANKSVAYPNGESFGNIEISSVCVDGESCEFQIAGEDDNILIVPLKTLLYPDEKVDIAMQYNVSLPNINHRFGYGEETVNLANFYPIACVYDENRGYMEKLYTASGDPFYSDIANYEVKIEYNKSYMLASTGTNQTTVTKDDKITICKANRVRDFAIVLSKNFQLLSQRVGNVEMEYYFTDDQNAKSSLDLSCKALSFFSESFGQYPYAKLSVVQNDFLYGGMEYPNLVMISNQLDEEEKYYVIVHEIAHQWWYGIVGNNEYDEAWVDESMTEYSTALFFENHDEYGFDYDTIVTKANDSFKFFFDVYKSILNEVDTSMDRSLYEFATEPEYFHCIYTQGIIMFDSLREIVGEKKIYKCFRDYFDRYAFSKARGVDLIFSFSKTCMTNLESFFESYLKGKVVEL